MSEESWPIHRWRQNGTKVGVAWVAAEYAPIVATITGTTQTGITFADDQNTYWSPWSSILVIKAEEAEA